MKKVHLKRKIANRIASGHPWIFANEVDKIEGSPEPGAVVDVYFHDGKFVGKGYFNQQSQIIVRLLTHDKKVEINDEFFLNKIKQCWNYRQKLGYKEN
jgi:23S rRNA (cytosine1962-C5)-methyltransferase